MTGRTAVLLLAALTLLAACGALPRPFQPEAKSRNQILTGPPVEATVVVEPIENLPAEASERTRQALVEALLGRGLAVESGSGNAGSLFVAGRFQGNGVVWLISEASGKPLRAERQPLDGLAAALVSGEPATVASVAGEAAEILAPILAPQEAGGGLPGHPGARLVVGEIDPAPGNAGELLPLALEVALRQASLPVAPPAEAMPGDFRILGSVRLGPAGGGLQQVTVTWTLEDYQGKTLGAVEQGNQVEPGSLDGSWSAVAPDIAEAAVEGLVDLLYRLPRKP